MKRDIRARLRTAADRRKALEQYEEMRARGHVRKAIVIVETTNGDIEVLGQSLTPWQMGPLLVAAADCLAQSDSGRKIVRLVARQEPEKRGEWNQSAPRAREITTADDGTLIPPKGENFISCGECHHPFWLVLHRDSDDTPARTACSHCGNEVVNRIAVGVGHA